MIDFNPTRCERAIELAMKAHKDQKDRGGAAYIDHCRHVAESSFTLAIDEGYAHGFAARCWGVGLLHDVLEDCDWATLEMVEEAIGIDAQAVLDLTKRRGQKREDYLDAISRNRLASIVKRCDLAHNMDLSRIQNPSEKDIQRRERYRQELEFLEQMVPAMARAWL